MWAPKGDATSNGRPMLILSDRRRAQRRRRIQCVESFSIQMPKASLTTAEMRTESTNVQPPKS
jgi:hypothetical protein